MQGRAYNTQLPPTLPGVKPVILLHPGPPSKYPSTHIHAPTSLSPTGSLHTRMPGSTVSSNNAFHLLNFVTVSVTLVIVSEKVTTFSSSSSSSPAFRYSSVWRLISSTLTVAERSAFTCSA